MLKQVSFIAILLLAACSKEGSFTEAVSGGQSGSITRFAVYNNFMYLLNPNEVLTYDLADPDKPVLVNRLTTDYGLETIFIYDNAIYLGSTTALYILDISNPAAPEIQSETIREGSFQGGCDPVVVKEQYAYSTVKIIRNICGNIGTESALLVYDVSGQKCPSPGWRLPLNLPNGLGYKDHYLFVCDQGANRLEVFDIADPLALDYLPNQSIEISDPIDLIVAGNKMIVSTGSDFQIFDLSNFPVVKRVGQITK
ncbi:MAG: hypothetical protein IPL65_21510 [Lewinellaceae bacterium]|nr:hypothetical protein [Lewinellaceae bacterium]